MSSSQPGRIASSASRMVTLEPRSASSEANSQPTTPPPITATDAGSSLRSKNSSEVMTQRPSTSKPGQDVGHRAGGQHDVAPHDDRAGVLAVEHLDPALVPQRPRPDERGDLAALEQPGQALPELVDHGVLALLAHREVERDVGHVDAELLRRRRSSGARRPSRGTPWPGCSPGAGRSRRPCPARRWRPRARPPRRRGPWRSRPGRRRSRRCRTLPRCPSPVLFLCAHDDVRPARSAPRDIPIAPARVPSPRLARAAVAAYRSPLPDRPAGGRRQPLDTGSRESAAMVASSSTRSFQRSPECPLTQRKLDGDVVRHGELDERLPQVPVGHRLVLRVLPVASQPALATSGR